MTGIPYVPTNLGRHYQLGTNVPTKPHPEIHVMMRPGRNGTMAGFLKIQMVNPSNGYVFEQLWQHLHTDLAGEPLDGTHT